jgi:hypothetical protein
VTGVSFRSETRPEASRCAAPGCDNPITTSLTGRPARFCGAACRARAHRQRHAGAPAAAEADIGSASSRGRPVHRAWLVRLRRGDRSVVVAIGLRQAAAERLVEQINELLADPT